MPAQKNRKRLPAPESLSHPAPAQPAAEHPAVEQLSGKALAALLMDPQRNVTVLVISHIPEQQFRIDPHVLAARLGQEARTFMVVNGDETHQLEKGLPSRLHIYGTGARVYPHGERWLERVSRPHLLHRSTALPQLYDTLEHEVLAAQRFNPSRPHTASLPVISPAVVKGFPGEDRALVELLPGGETALIRSEDLLPGIPLDWLVAKGQELTGVLNPATHVLDIKALLLPHPSPVTVYQQGDVALGRVKSVSPRHAWVQLWPGSDFRIGVERISSNDLDSAEDLLTEGEVVRVRVLYENGAVRLSMLDVDDDEPAVRAPALLRGGPPWLEANRPYASIFTTGTAVASPSPQVPLDNGAAGLSGVDLSQQESLLSPAQRRSALQSTQMQLEAARHTIAELLAAAKRQGATDQVARALQDQLKEERRGSGELARELHLAEHQVEVLKTDLAKTREALVQVRRQRRSATSRTESTPEKLFLDPEEQFNFDLLALWARMVPAAEKRLHPLGNFSSSPQFLESWAALTEQQRNKTLRAVVDLVADRQGPLRKREPHVLRLNDGAHAAPTLRGEDVCWRLYVEQGTAGALRLHYWKLQTGGYELHAVVPHDVVKP
ncbi:hypothetical protein [Arthrobacter psychrochitiniphilus]|uniref:Uncharacterized protein n=1 Tax=Arthrobacter psychrochitiniphilus TaxID=291045 RepID=A0A2V3DVS4_9MICC|nr:hypothetical protein [Arthrobacter psychrochitiniphilus]NYG16362.1 hypothetical protein [Arthrobacter psychrochitiniphilus]PXA69478.1 hypothetical protein CVS29_02730 [Arthrobacter psychrochitiniphilus]